MKIQRGISQTSLEETLLSSASLTHRSSGVLATISDAILLILPRILPFIASPEIVRFPLTCWSLDIIPSENGVTKSGRPE